MLKQFIAGSCYSYILGSQNEAIVVDPHISLLEEYEIFLHKNQFTLKAIIDTHTHADHFSLAAVLKKKFKAPVLMHEKAISTVADKRFKDGDTITAGSDTLKVIYTPGHTDDAVSLYSQDRLFTGDVLLIGSVGRTDFQNGSPESMFDTLQKLKTLPDETAVFPGHDYHENRSSTIAKEKEKNPFLKETNKESFAKNMREKVMPKPFNIENIVRVNQKGQAAVLEMVSPQDALALAKKNPQVKFLDVRSQFEFDQDHIKDAINVPIDTFSAKVNDLIKFRQTYIVMCFSGTRAAMAADMLIQAGASDVIVLDGSMKRWLKEKLPVIKGESGISLERQIRIIAGSIVLFGILMAWLVHWAFIFISAFVSCGLIFSGLTNFCLMGMLLMKLPYNKKLYKPKASGGTCAVAG